MVSRFDALKIAKDYYYKSMGEKRIAKVLEYTDSYIIYPDSCVGRIGEMAIKIDKKDGKIRNFILPSKENFAILKNSKEIKMEDNEYVIVRR